MKRLIWIATAAAALVVAGVAVGHGFGSKSVAAVSTTFSATSASNVQTSTCTGSDGTTYATTRGTYTGTATGATGDSNLNGPITIEADSVINNNSGAGLVTGRFSIQGSSGHVSGGFAAVYSAGSIAGAAGGGTATSGTSLIGNLSAVFSTSGGFSSGKLGGGTSGGNAVEVTQDGCRPVPPPRPDKIDVHGTVSAVSSTSITAGGVTCVVPSSLQGTVANIHTGDRVEIRCEVSNGQTTLDSVSGDHESYGARHHR